jgi:rhodanese-related sulfurtransferase
MRLEWCVRISYPRAHVHIPQRRDQPSLIRLPRIIIYIRPVRDGISGVLAPVIVFCMSGRRAGKAKETLEALGYTKVLNAGGLNDLLNKLK